MHALSQQNFIQQLTIDCVIFGYQDKQLRVLAPKLIFNGDFWTLPRGFVYQDEDIDDAAQRILQERTGISDIYFEQFHVMGKANRNSKAFLDRLIELNQDRIRNIPTNRREYDWFTQRFISIGYYALVNIDKVIPQKTEFDESLEWYSINQLPPMIMDSDQIVDKALESFQLTLDQKATAFYLLPETFTMKEVQELYETIFDKSFARNNFQKRILDLNALERLEKKFTGAANKAPYLYRIQK